MQEIMHIQCLTNGRHFINKVIVHFKNSPEQQGKNKHNNDGLKCDITVSYFSKKISPDDSLKERKCISEYIY